MVAAALVLCALGGSPGSLHARVDAMRAQVRANPELEPEDRSLLEAKLSEVDSALARLEQVAGQGEERKRQMQPVMIAGTAILADDATGVGTADDALLPIMALAAVAVHLRTQAPASDQELQAALGRLDSAIEAAIKAGQAVLMSQQVGKQVRSLMDGSAQTLARILGRSIGGRPPDHQEDPKRDRPHWWKELKAFLDQIARKGLTPAQLGRELIKKGPFTSQQLAEIERAVLEAAKLVGKEPPDFPRVAAP